MLNVRHGPVRDGEATNFKSKDTMMGKPFHWILRLATLAGIPVALLTALVFDIEFSRLIYGKADLPGLAVEIASLLALAVLISALRWSLRSETAPAGIFRPVFDFLALVNWHPAVKVAAASLCLLTAAEFVHGYRWLFKMIPSLGTRLLDMTDVQAALDGGAVMVQYAGIGGVTLLFFLHLISRLTRRNSCVPWVLLPVFLIGVLIAEILIGMIIHCGD
jgi:hypothetical protein